MHGSLAAEERTAVLLRDLRTDGRVEIEDAAYRLNVHPMTIRRALKVLERDGRARLVRGGAVHVGTEEFAIRQSRALSAKKKIAEKLAPLLGAHETVGFDASSTVHVLAQNMPPTAWRLSSLFRANRTSPQSCPAVNVTREQEAS
jgi:DeoR family fructose operon transcriptional repressor